MLAIQCRHYYVKIYCFWSWLARLMLASSWLLNYVCLIYTIWKLQKAQLFILQRKTIFFCDLAEINRTFLLRSETNDMNAGLVIEVWCKGFLWDRFLGYYYIPLSEVSYMNEVTRNQCNLNHTEVQQFEQHTTFDMRDTNSNTQPDIITDTVHNSLIHSFYTLK